MTASTAAPTDTHTSAPAPPTEAGQVAELLRAFLADRSDASGTVLDVRRAGSGRSRDNWLFDLVDDGGREPLILRTDPEGGLVDTDRAVEFAVLRALEGHGLPAPIARWLDADGAGCAPSSKAGPRSPTARPVACWPLFLMQWRHCEADDR